MTIIRDIKTEEFESAYSEGSILEGLIELYSKGFKMISSEEYAKLVLAKRDEFVSTNPIIERALFFPRTDYVHLIRSRPTLKEIHKTIKANLEGEESYITTWQANNYLKEPNIKLEQRRVQEYGIYSEVLEFLFMNHAKEYGDLLKRFKINAINLYFPENKDYILRTGSEKIWLNKSKEKPFVRHLLVQGLKARGNIMALDARCYERIRGYKEINSLSKQESRYEQSSEILVA